VYVVVVLSRCIGPKVTSRRLSTYTIAGFAGYAAATALAVVLGQVWELTLAERAITCFAPPVAFLIVVTIASAVAGQERIVFYQAALGGLAAVIGSGAIAGARIDRMLDVSTLGIGTFLVFGRLGCWSVACCHGTLGKGVVYGPEHVEVGFWARWSGRPLWPVQAIESIASALLVVGALVLPGSPAAIYLAGYAIVRFGLELVRGDGARPYKHGLSEAQWVSVGTAVVLSVWQPGAATIGIAGVLVIGAAILVGLRRTRELFLPPHLRELERTMQRAYDGTRHETSLNVAVSRHVLPDGRIDWVLSSTHPHWNADSCRALARLMWSEWQLVVGKTPGVMHVVRREEPVVHASDLDRVSR